MILSIHFVLRQFCIFVFELTDIFATSLYFWSAVSIGIQRGLRTWLFNLVCVLYVFCNYCILTVFFNGIYLFRSFCTRAISFIVTYIGACPENLISLKLVFCIASLLRAVKPALQCSSISHNNSHNWLRKKILAAPTQITLSPKQSIGWPIAWSDRCREVRLE